MFRPPISEFLGKWGYFLRPALYLIISAPVAAVAGSFARRAPLLFLSLVLYGICSELEPARRRIAIRRLNPYRRGIAFINSYHRGVAIIESYRRDVAIIEPYRLGVAIRKSKRPRTIPEKLNPLWAGGGEASI